MIGTRVPPPVALRLAKAAARRRLTPSALMRELLTAALDAAERADVAPP